MKRLHFGVVTILEGNIKHNKFFHGLWESSSQAVKDMKKAAREELPDGPILNAVAYRIPDGSVREAAALLSQEGVGNFLR